MSYDIVVEKIPGFTRRIGDQVLQGSNNTMIVLGTDRASFGPATIDDGFGSADGSSDGTKAGSIYVVAGRNSEDPDLLKDLSYIYLSMKTDVDTNLGLTLVESNSDESAAAIIKSNAVRVVYRKDLKICLTDGKNYIFMDDSLVRVKVGKNMLTLDGSKLLGEIGDSTITVKSGDVDIRTGESHIHATSNQIVLNSSSVKMGDDSASHPVPYGDNWKQKFNDHKHMTPVGLSGPPLADSLIQPSDISPISKTK